MIKEPMFISPRTFRDYEQYKTDCARASGWNEAMAFIFAEELETERTRTIREKFFVVETEPQTKRYAECYDGCNWAVGSPQCEGCEILPKTEWYEKCVKDEPQTERSE